MESIAYIINRHFTLVAVDTNYMINSKDIKVLLTQVKKVYKLNDYNLVSVVGNPYKSTDIFKYLLKLNELGYDGDYENILEDINDVFNSSKTEITKGLRELSNIISRFDDGSDNIKIEELFEHFKDKPEYIAILEDAISSMDNNHSALANILVFGWDASIKKTRLANFTSIGHNLTGTQLEMVPDFIYIRLASANLHPNETSKIENELVQRLSSILTTGWDVDKDKIEEVILKGKEIIIEGLKKITPYESTALNYVRLG